MCFEDDLIDVDLFFFGHSCFSPRLTAETALPCCAVGMKIFLSAQDEKYFPDAAAFCPHRYTDEEATSG